MPAQLQAIRVITRTDLEDCSAVRGCPAIQFIHAGNVRIEFLNDRGHHVCNFPARLAEDAAQIIHVVLVEIVIKIKLKFRFR